MSMSSDVSRERGTRERAPMTGSELEEVVPYDHHATQPAARPPIQVDLDEILGTLALELARVRICNQCQHSVPSLINDLALIRAGRPRRASPGGGRSSR